MKIGDTVTLSATVRDIVGSNVLVVTDDGREYWLHQAHVSGGSSETPAPTPAAEQNEAAPPVAPTNPAIENAVKRLVAEAHYDEQTARTIVEAIGPAEAVNTLDGVKKIDELAKLTDEPELPAPPAAGLPSAADLDAVAEEEKAAEAAKPTPSNESAAPTASGA